MDKTLRTLRSFQKSVGCAALSVAVVSILATACSSSSTSSTTTTASAGTSSVLTPSYAKSAGFPKTLDAAKKSAVTSQKGCLSTTGAVYEDAAGKTALISSILNCDSTASASTAFSAIQKHYAADTAIAVPKGLGTSAFATASIAPQYLMVWKTGSKVAITAVDVNLAASSTTSSTVASPPITAAQAATLARAAEAQNALMK
jgi:hypothetical protein